MKRVCTLALVLAALSACRGQPSAKPPIHVFDDMDQQPKFQAQEKTTFFPDNAIMRQPVEGTVAQGFVTEDSGFTTGKVNGQYLAVTPGEMTSARLQRGMERFNIYCAPCHDRTGSGNGMVVQRGYPRPVDLMSDRVLGLPDGEIFEVISNGVRNMPSYGAQVPAADRWAIVAYLRVLQRSQHATLEDVPPEFRDRIEAAAQGGGQ